MSDSGREWTVEGRDGGMGLYRWGNVRHRGGAVEGKKTGRIVAGGMGWICV